MARTEITNDKWLVYLGKDEPDGLLFEAFVRGGHETLVKIIDGGCSVTLSGSNSSKLPLGTCMILDTVKAMIKIGCPIDAEVISMLARSLGFDDQVIESAVHSSGLQIEMKGTVS